LAEGIQQRAESSGGKMKANSKFYGISFGYLVGICLIFMLCLGGFWTVMMRSFDISTPTPILPTQEAATSDNAAVPASTLEEVMIPSPTLPPDLIAMSAKTSPTLPSDPQVSFSIPVSGASCIPDNPPQTGKVVEVVDGDTIKVLLDQDGLTYSVRYIGMDTPEDTSQVEQFGPEATAKNAELVYDKTVTLIRDVSETDQYGRLLRYVLADGVFVNYELVAQGYANTVSYPPDVSCISLFQEAERGASASQLGLWAVPPVLAVIPTTADSAENAPCACSGPDLDCKDFKTHNSAQACYEYCRNAGHGDIHRLDGNDNDGLACESLP
jgi:endonuclease YncB( thermonuclease family)